MTMRRKRPSCGIDKRTVSNARSSTTLYSRLFYGYLLLFPWWNSDLSDRLFRSLFSAVEAYHHRPCHSASIRADYSFTDCYIPDQNPNLQLSEAAFVFSHNAATGYITPTSLSKTGLSWWYSKNQVGSVYQQLNDGARALDLRPKYVNQTTVVFSHGSITIQIALEQLLQDAIQWCRDNPSELVLLLPSHFDCANNNERYGLVTAMSSIYQQYGITYLSCSDVYGWTVGDLMTVAQLPNSDGYLVALDGQDGSTSCVWENYVENELVTCYDQEFNVSCKSSASSIPLEKLTDYVLASANNEQVEYNGYSLGPPSDTERYPFFEIQALWQVDGHAVAQGMRRVSSILEDNRASNLNAKMVDLIYSGALDRLSLFTVDNVALHGNALLSVLRNTCGQSVSNTCGKQVSKPRMTYFHVTVLQIVWTIVGIYLSIAVLAMAWKVIPVNKRPKVITTTLARIQQSVADHRKATQKGEDPTTTNISARQSMNKKESLLS